MFRSVGGKKSWISPTDRELTMRAKLNLGWSVHSSKIFGRCEPFEESEIQMLQDVIEKAQRIDAFERQRVCQMTERLANMKRHAVGDGLDSCAMCACNFGFIRLSISYCQDCKKAVCSKCRVDIINTSHETCILCKICSETRELWKKSGGWFYKCLPVHFPPGEVDEPIICPSNNRSYTTWSHRTPEIVRMQSFEPPEMDVNNILQGRDWTLAASSDSLIQSKESLNEADLQNSKLTAGLVHERKESSMQYLAVPGLGENLAAMTALSTSCPAIPT